MTSERTELEVWEYVGQLQSEYRNREPNSINTTRQLVAAIMRLPPIDRTRVSRELRYKHSDVFATIVYSLLNALLEEPTKELSMVVEEPNQEDREKAATAFRSFPNMLYYAWQEHPEFLTDEVKGALAARTQGAGAEVPAMDDDENTGDDMDK